MPDSILDNTEHATELSEPLTEAAEFLAATSVDVSLRTSMAPLSNSNANSVAISVVKSALTGDLGLKTRLEPN